MLVLWGVVSRCNLKINIRRISRRISKRVNKKSYNRGKCLLLKQDNWYCQDGLSIFLPNVIGGEKAVLKIFKKAQRPIVVTRDAVDLLQNSFAEILDNPRLVFVVSFAQVQKLLRAVYYPKILTFNIQLAQFVDILHKFTITYPVTICAFHAEHLVIAHGGDVVTQNWNELL